MNSCIKVFETKRCWKVYLLEELEDFPKWPPSYVNWKSRMEVYYLRYLICYSREPAGLIFCMGGCNLGFTNIDLCFKYLISWGSIPLASKMLFLWLHWYTHHHTQSHTPSHKLTVDILLLFIIKSQRNVLFMVHIIVIISLIASNIGASFCT